LKEDTKVTKLYKLEYENNLFLDDVWIISMRRNGIKDELVTKDFLWGKMFSYSGCSS